MFGLPFFDLLPLRIWGTMTNFTLLAVGDDVDARRLLLLEGDDHGVALGLLEGGP